MTAAPEAKVMPAVDLTDTPWQRALDAARPPDLARRWKQPKAERREVWQAKATCPECRGALRPEEDVDGLDGFSDAEVDALRGGRLGFLACDGCRTLYPWEAA